MVSFHNVRLPVNVEKGAEGGPEFKTTVLALSSGHEKRNIEWERVKGGWDIAYGINTKAELEEVIAFFYARRAKAYGFRFKDWTDYEIEDQSIGIGGGVTTVFQMFKRYTSGAYYFDRRITRLVADSLTVKVNGVLQTEGVQYTADDDTGIITFGTAPGTAATATLTTTLNPTNGQTFTIN